MCWTEFFKSASFFLVVEWTPMRSFDVQIIGASLITVALLQPIMAITFADV